MTKPEEWPEACETCGEDAECEHYYVWRIEQLLKLEART